MRRSTLVRIAAALVLLAGIALLAWAQRGAIATRLLASAYDHAFRQDPFEGLPDGLTVALCGTGSPLPDPTRQGPCTAIVAGRRIFVVDIGEGAVRELTLLGLPPSTVEALFLTHFHSDHIADLGELMLQHWAGGAATSPLPVYGPTGVQDVVGGFEAAYRLDRAYRIAHHSPRIVPPSGFGGAPHGFAAAPDGPDAVLIDQPDLKVVAFPVDHGPVKPAVGYLFVYKGRRVVVSGDTAPSTRLTREAQDADVLVHEALSPTLVSIQRDAALRHGKANVAQILHDILTYHTTPEQAAAIAARAHARVLLLTHIIPPIPTPALDGPFLGRAREIFRGPIRVGRDGDLVILPAGTREIRFATRRRLGL